MKRDRVVRANLDRAVEDTLRALGQLDEVEDVMVQCLPTPGAQSYDSTTSTSVVWCEFHDRKVEVCHRAEDDEGHKLTCTGTPDPRLTDPTGNAALTTRVWSDVREAGRRSARMRADAEWFVGLVGRWRTDADAALIPAVAKDLEAQNRPMCERHLRYGYEHPSRTNTGTRVKLKRKLDGAPTYVLADPHKLCQWCEDFVRDFGRLATEREVHDHVAGKRIRRPA